jgi:two-component system LytT family response regulator
MVNCIALVSNADIIAQLSAYIGEEPEFQLIGVCSNIEDAANLFNKKTIDLIFAEIGVSEFDSLTFIKSLVNTPAVVFLSKDKAYAYDAIKFGAVDFLLEPLAYNDFKQAAAKALVELSKKQDELLQQARSSKFVNNNKFIFIKSEYKIIRIDLSQIKFIESMREYVRFHIDNSRPIMSLLTIRAVENYLPKEKFMRVHRSYIVNLDKIELIERARIVFDGDTFIPISEQYKDKFQSFVDKNFAQ